ncbi:MAG TPA: universal stress protein [Syntrophaceae bacterium]|nr:universal stress protein [Syntrophaceae bacterium]
MKSRILIAMDGSKNAIKAVEYVARTVGKTKGIQITLYHVFPEAPPLGIEKEATLKHHPPSFREGIEDFRSWLKQKRAVMEKVMDKAREILVKAGIAPKNIKVRMEEKKEGIARDILKEAEKGKYDTIIVGRRGLTATKAFFFGSISSKIVQHAKNCTVWVVE